MSVVSPYSPRFARLLPAHLRRRLVSARIRTAGTRSCQVIEHIEPLDPAQAVEDGRTRRRIQLKSIDKLRCSVGKGDPDVPRAASMRYHWNLTESKGYRAPLQIERLRVARDIPIAKRLRLGKELR